METRLGIRVFSATLAIALMYVPICGAESLSAEEAAVRSAYSAVVLRSQIASIHSSYFTGHLSTDKQLSIEISGLHGGSVSEILATSLSNVVTVPSNELLISGPGTFSINDHFVGSFVEVENWGPVNSRYNFNNNYAIFDAPVSKLLESFADPEPPYSRYLAFTVSLTTFGKDRSYNALALFRQGESIPRTVDYILGPPEGLIGKNLIEQLTMLATNIPIADKTSLNEFLRSITMGDACVKDSATNLCCDATSKFCGVPAQAFVTERQ